MKKYLFVPLVILVFFARPSFADDSDLYSVQAKPNILVILDNSNSMDENFYGEAVGSYSPNSKSVVGKKALRDIMQQFKDKFRMGLMTYELAGFSGMALHNMPLFISYEPKSYCPNPPPECVKYAQTGNSANKSVCEAGCRVDNPLFDATYVDEILTYYAVGTPQRNGYAERHYPKTKRMPNPTDAGKYIYYKGAYPLYTGSNWGTAFGYAEPYDPAESPVGVTSDGYYFYNTKTGTSDSWNAADPAIDGYADYYNFIPFSFTDSDLALGNMDLGRRTMFKYVGQAWEVNSSPGKGYLDVKVDDLTDSVGSLTGTYSTLWAKFDPKENDETGYMSCGGNTCSFVTNAGLTPTAGTLQSAIDYLKGSDSPIDLRCRKTFILYVTDGLPSVDESGNIGNAGSLLPAVEAKIQALRAITKTIAGFGNVTFDVQTYVLGVGLSDQAKQKLDIMARDGGTDVDGHAYYADNPSEMMNTLRSVFSNIIERGYSFTAPVVPSVRVTANDTAYLASFEPKNSASPFWPGHLKAYKLDASGLLPVDAGGFPANAPLWVSSIPSPGSRRIKTKTAASAGLVDFTTSNVTKDDLDVSTNTKRDEVVAYVRNQKLGDIIHSNPVVVGAPSSVFKDDGFSGAGEFYDDNKTRTKVVIVGSNDGMLHAFDASTGEEVWAFIPKSLLENLKKLDNGHEYMVDSSPKVADVWFYSNPTDTTKSDTEWRTVLVCGLRKGGTTYFALDITDTLNPQYLWEFPDSPTSEDPGQSWSEPAIGRVRINVAGTVVERWVAFIGGGLDYTMAQNEGKALFVVDMKTGQLIKEFSKAVASTQYANMDHSMPASPAIVDTNFDGYVDKVYIGDIKGQMWVFDVSSDNRNSWIGRRLLENDGSDYDRSIYYPPAVAFDQNRKPWVFFGTGDREEPNHYKNRHGETGYRERFYAIKDDGVGTYPRSVIGNLINVTANNTFSLPLGANKGWFMELERSGPSPGKSLEKVLSKPSVFNNLVYFTTYTNLPTTDPCSNAGTARLYIVEYLSGGGALDVDSLDDLSGSPSAQRSIEITGGGVPSTPVITVDTNGDASVVVGTSNSAVFSQKAFSPGTTKSILYWREVIP